MTDDTPNVGPYSPSLRREIEERYRAAERLRKPAQSQERHTPAPWTVVSWPVNKLVEYAIRGTEPVATMARYVNAEANARRIVACVNACEGMLTENLEGTSMDQIYRSLREERDALKALNAELVEALKNAELFLRVGHAYAPDEFVSDQHKATGEWLKTRGLATTMLRVADAARELLSKAKP